MLYTTNLVTPVIKHFTNNDHVIERISYSKDPLSIMLRAESVATRYEQEYGGCRTQVEQQRMVRALRNATAVRLAQ